MVLLNRSSCGEMRVDGRNETVAVSRHRLHKSGVLRVIPQRVPHSAHRAVDRVVEIDKGINAPELLLDLFTGNHFTGTFNQEGQNLQRLVLQLDTDTALSQFPGPQIQFKHSELE